MTRQESNVTWRGDFDILITDANFQRFENLSAGGNFPRLFRPSNLILFHNLLVFPHLKHDTVPGHSNLPTFQFVLPLTLCNVFLSTKLHFPSARSK